jgi:spore maturation protein SpmA
MLNYVWSFLLLTGLVAGALFGNMGVMVEALLERSKSAVLDIALPLAGTMMLWLGILRVMEKAGLMEVVAKILSPVLRRLFPEVPPTHPAMGAMTMNIAANMLGLGNSATPLGLKAMGYLQELNPNKQSATNAMCMFLALNTAGFTLIPMGAIIYLSSGGVKDPYAVIAPTLLATACATLTAVVAVKLLQRLPAFRVVPDEVEDKPGEPAADGSQDPAAQTARPAAPFRLSPLRMVLLSLVTAGFTLGAVLQFAPQARAAVLQATGLQGVLDAAGKRAEKARLHQLELKAAADAAGVTDTTATAAAADTAKEGAGDTSGWRRQLRNVSVLAIPITLLIAVVWGLAKGVPVYEEMVEGAKEGFGVALRIMPFLVIMFAALTCFRESGALMLVQHALRPLLEMVSFPVELLPLAIMRPLSGSGSSGILNEIILHPSSTDLLRNTAAVMYGSTETTFYVLAVYFGSVSIRRSRHALAAGLCADVVGIAMAVVVSRLMFA